MTRSSACAGGADQYLVKPIRFTELAAYITAMACRVAPDNWRLNLIERRLHAPGGQAESMSSQEMSLLELLARNSGRVVDRPAIAKAFGADWLEFMTNAIWTSWSAVCDAAGRAPPVSSCRCGPSTDKATAFGGDSGAVIFCCGNA